MTQFIVFHYYKETVIFVHTFCFELLSQIESQLFNYWPRGHGWTFAVKFFSRRGARFFFTKTCTGNSNA